MRKEAEKEEDKEAQAEEEKKEDATQEKVSWIAERQNKPERSLLLKNESLYILLRRFGYGIQV